MGQAELTSQQEVCWGRWNRLSGPVNIFDYIYYFLFKPFFIQTLVENKHNKQTE